MLRLIHYILIDSDRAIKGVLSLRRVISQLSLCDRGVAIGTLLDIDLDDSVEGRILLDELSTRTREDLLSLCWVGSEVIVQHLIIPVFDRDRGLGARVSTSLLVKGFGGIKGINGYLELDGDCYARAVFELRLVVCLGGFLGARAEEEEPAKEGRGLE